MLIKIFTLLLAIGTSLALLPPQAKLKTERGLIDFLMKSRAVMGDHNGDHTDYCFDRYLPILKKVSDQYETDFKRCVEARELECLAIDAIYAHPLHNITETAKGTCLLLQTCSTHKNTAESFDCFAATVSRS